MIVQLVIGSLMIVLSVIVEAGFIAVAEATLKRREAWFRRGPTGGKAAAALALSTLWLMGSHSVVAWLWALCFMALDVFDALEPALYFSVVSFTTLGFGDVLLPEPWRLLAGLCAANGLLIFGVSTAFLVELLIRMRRG